MGDRDCEHGQLARTCLICELSAALRKAEADLREAREQERLAHIDAVNEMHLRFAAEELAVWAVRKGVMVGHDECVRPCIWFDVHRGVEYDGTDAGILAALRRAMKGEG